MESVTRRSYDGARLRTLTEAGSTLKARHKGSGIATFCEKLDRTRTYLNYVLPHLKIDERNACPFGICTRSAGVKRGVCLRRNAILVPAREIGKVRRSLVSLAEETTIIESKFTSGSWSVKSSAVSVFFMLSYISHLLRRRTSAHRATLRRPRPHHDYRGARLWPMQTPAEVLRLAICPPTVTAVMLGKCSVLAALYGIS